MTALVLTGQADGVRELNGREDRRLLIDRVHVEDGSSKFPGVPQEGPELGPGQDRVAQQDPLRRFKHQTSD